jgi:hypothetical protein
LHNQQYAFIHYKGFRSTIHKLYSIYRAIKQGIRAKAKNIFSGLLRCTVNGLQIKPSSLYFDFFRGLNRHLIPISMLAKGGHFWTSENPCYDCLPHCCKDSGSGQRGQAKKESAIFSTFSPMVKIISIPSKLTIEILAQVKSGVVRAMANQCDLCKNSS